MNKTWFCADHHFGHQRIIELAGRPFTSVEEMNEEMIERHNRVVAVDDTVWILGDVALGPIKESLPLVGKLNGHKYLIAGNHDRCFAGAQPDPELRARWVDAYVQQGGFIAVVSGAAWLNAHPKDRRPILLPRLGGAYGPTVQVSHFPYAGESNSEREDRYAESRPKPYRLAPGEDPVWLLHGHVHEAWCVRGTQINVGVDVWDFAPVEAEVLAGLIEGGPQ